MSAPAAAHNEQASEPDTRRSGAAIIIVVLCFGAMSSALMQTLVIPIQAELPRLLSTSTSNASWVVTATLLGGAVAMPVAGRLADILGKQRILVASAVILLVGSVICAVTTTLMPMLVGRTLQGIAMGYIPVAISLVRDVIPPKLAASAIATISATLGVGGAIGLPLAAWIAQQWDWHAMFYVAAGLSVAMVLATVLLVPNTRSTERASFDAVGAAGLAVGLVATLVGVSKANDWGWGDPATLGSIGGGLIVLLAWGFYQLHRRDPLVDLRSTARRPVLLTNVVAVLVGFGMMAQSIVVPQIMVMPGATGYGLGQSLLQAGLWMAPGGLMMMVMAPVSSRLINSIGAKHTLTIAAAVIAGGYLVTVMLMDEPWKLLIGMCVISAGVGIGYAAMPTLVLENSPRSEAGSAVGVNTLARSIGTTLAGAVMATLLTSQTIVLAPGTPAIPTAGAFKLCFVFGAAASLAGALLALVITRRGEASRLAA